MSRVPNQSDLIDLALVVTAETEKAYRLSDGTRTAWVPKSQVERDEDNGSFAMPEWLAKDKGFI